jgi:hypothetical protein
MEVSGQLHVLTVLSPGKQPIVHTPLTISVGYLTTQYLDCMVECYMKDERERIRKEAVGDWPACYPCIFLDGLTKAMKKVRLTSAPDKIRTEHSVTQV